MWEALYKTYYPELLRYAAASCHDAEQAEDFVQDVFLKALQNTDVLASLGPHQRRAWLYRTLKNRMIDHFRRDTLESDSSEPLLAEEQRNRALRHWKIPFCCSGFPSRTRHCSGCDTWKDIPRRSCQICSACRSEPSAPSYLAAKRFCGNTWRKKSEIPCSIFVLNFVIYSESTREQGAKKG